MHFDHGQNKNHIFIFFFLFHRLYRGSEVTMGSEDTLKTFLKGKFVQKGSRGTCFDHDQLEIKTFPIYARPNVQNFHLLIKSQ